MQTARHDPFSDCPPITGETSDGFHTFNELYDHRVALWAVVAAYVPGAWKSLQHEVGSDTPMFDGYFIVGAHLRGVGQVTYHVSLDYWDAMPGIELEHAPAYDGHDAADVVIRLWGHVEEVTRVRG